MERIVFDRHRDEAKRLLALAAPAIAGQIGTMMLGVVDMLMLGHYGTHELDASALGNLWAWGTMIFGVGVIFGMDPIVSQAFGAKDAKRQALALQRGLLAALGVSIPLGLLWLLAEPILVFFGQEPHLARDAGRFLLPQIPGLAGMLLFFAFRSYQMGRGIVRPTMWVMLGANVLNLALDWALIFGHLGLAPHGLVGSGIATGITRLAMAAALGWWTFGGKLHEGGWAPWSRETLSLDGFAEVLKHGLPVGLQYGLETWAFQIATIWAGWLGKDALGAHSVVLNLASMAFMVPLGLSLAAVTRVGNRLGEGDVAGARLASRVSLALGALVMTGSASVFLLGRHLLPALYSNDAGVRAAAAAILPIAAAFQLFDGTQAVGGGVLRGMGDTKPAALFNLIGYYLLALPFAYWLGFTMHAGLAGIWWGLAVGLALIAGSLVAFILRAEPKAIAAAT